MIDSNIVVYTAIFNDYDVLMEPEVKSQNVDYICFTDSKSTVKGIWETIMINECGLSPKLMSGKIKTLPHRFFPDYDYSVWVDGNVQIQYDVCELVNKYLSGADLAVPCHPRRNCIYDEAEVCIDKNIVDPDKVRTQMDRYRTEGFPEHFGLSETRLLFRNHNEKQIIRMMETWWEEYQHGGERDQLSFEYAAWKHNMNYKNWEQSYSDSDYFSKHRHKPYHGLIGDIWESLFRVEHGYSGRIGRVAQLSRIAMESYIDRGFFYLASQTRQYISRKL